MKNNLMPHDKNGCTHNWIHYAGKQCEWDTPSMIEVAKGRRHKADSNNIAYMYICTICQEMLWSSDKMFNTIPHYRVKESKNNGFKTISKRYNLMYQ